jgi:peptidyl-prolyl cis-trans isomerase B (cyclophilin B)
VKERLVAYRGKLVTVQEQQGSVPNGSGFVITTASAPDLDATNLVVGRVVQGMDVVEAISQLPTVKSNTGSPFFKRAPKSFFSMSVTAQQSIHCVAALGFGV